MVYNPAVHRRDSVHFFPEPVVSRIPILYFVCRCIPFQGAVLAFASTRLTLFSLFMDGVVFLLALQ